MNTPGRKAADNVNTCDTSFRACTLGRQAADNTQSGAVLPNMRKGTETRRKAADDTFLGGGVFTVQRCTPGDRVWRQAADGRGAIPLGRRATDGAKRERAAQPHRDHQPVVGSSSSLGKGLQECGVGST